MRTYLRVIQVCVAQTQLAATIAIASLLGCDPSQGIREGPYCAGFTVLAFWGALSQIVDLQKADGAPIAPKSVPSDIPAPWAQGLPDTHCEMMTAHWSVCVLCLQAFLLNNNLRLVLRSHEGPDARDRRNELPNMLQGYSLDHETSGTLDLLCFTALLLGVLVHSHTVLVPT